MSQRVISSLLAAQLLAALPALSGCDSASSFAPLNDKGVRLSMRVSFPPDRGDNYGSLFEAYDSNGRVVAGAGFHGVVNTRRRSDRRALNLFLRPSSSSADLTWEALPRPNDDGGAYLYDLNGQIFSQSGWEGTDSAVHVWDPAAYRWGTAGAALPDETLVGGKLLSISSREVLYDGAAVLTLPSDQELESFYYAGGILLLHRRFPADPAPNTELVAVPWSARNESLVDLSKAKIIRVQSPATAPFVYAYGQLNQHLLVALNAGPLYRFDGTGWDTVYEPPADASFQIYAMLNYQDALILGHYPSGNLYRYDGKELRLMEGWPPTPAAVPQEGREAQTLAIYRGELFVGVWPWGEIWRYDGVRWKMVKRAFSRPDLTWSPAPYDAEVIALGGYDRNLWGQRITSLIPFGSSLVVGTSNKSGAPFQPLFSFLSDTWREYGAVYRLTEPGHRSVPIQWKSTPTLFEMDINANRFQLYQDKVLIGTTELDASSGLAAPITNVAWGSGIYGTLRGRLMGSSILLPNAP